jgi:hypothetical protein
MYNSNGDCWFKDALEAGSARMVGGKTGERRLATDRRERWVNVNYSLANNNNSNYYQKTVQSN